MFKYILSAFVAAIILPNLVLAVDFRQCKYWTIIYLHFYIKKIQFIYKVAMEVLHQMK